MRLAVACVWRHRMAAQDRGRHSSRPPDLSHADSGAGWQCAHGNGFQVGLLALQSDAYDHESSYPFDVLAAQTEGMIGYLLERELRNDLGAGRTVATVVTMTEVDLKTPRSRIRASLSDRTITRLGQDAMKVHGCARGNGVRLPPSHGPFPH